MTSQRTWVAYVEKGSYNCSEIRHFSPHDSGGGGECAFLGGCRIQFSLGSCSRPGTRQDQSLAERPDTVAGRRHPLPRSLPVLPQGRRPGRRAQAAPVTQRAYPHRERRRSRMVSPSGRPSPRHALLVGPARGPALANRLLPAVSSVVASIPPQMLRCPTLATFSVARMGNHGPEAGCPMSRL